MKKIIVLLLSFMFLTSISACSESPEKLYGTYKEINNTRDKYGYIYILEIQEKKIYSKEFGWLDINEIYKNKNFWIIKASNFMKYKHPQTVKIKFINDSTIECVREISQKEITRTYIKTTKEEYKRIQNDQLLKEYPSLF